MGSILLGVLLSALCILGACIMAQIDDLKALLGGVNTALDDIKGDIDRLLEAAQANDLSEVLSIAQGLKDKADAVNVQGGDVPPSDPDE